MKNYTMSPTISYFGKFQVARLLKRGVFHCFASLGPLLRKDGSLLGAQEGPARAGELAHMYGGGGTPEAPRPVVIGK